MRELPVLFNAKMVNAILKGKKTQTRRLMKPQPKPDPNNKGKHVCPYDAAEMMVGAEDMLRADDPIWKGLAKSCCPIAQIGDHLYVRESIEVNRCGSVDFVQYKADGATSTHEWNYKKDYAPSIHMKKEHARIWLEVTDIRAERVQDISEWDAEHEGVAPAFLVPGTDIVCSTPMYKYGFAKIWEETGGDWKSNPWVWVLGFKRVNPNKNEV